MAPWIEGEFQCESEGYNVSYFTIDLLDGSVFNTDTFDALSKRIDPHDKSYLKFLVIENKMYVFEDTTEREKIQALSHLSVYKKLSIEGELQCAGKISVDHSDRKRKLASGSVTLLKEGLLSLANSNRYRDEVLLKVLGADFEI